MHALRRVLPGLPDGCASRSRQGGPGKNRGRHHRPDHRRQRHAGGRTLGIGVQRQRQLHSGLPRRHRHALHGPARPRLCEGSGRRHAAFDTLAAGLSDNEPRRAGAVAPAAPARDIGPRQRAIRAAAAPKPARRRLLHRVQYPEDAAHCAVVPRRARSPRRRLQIPSLR